MKRAITLALVAHWPATVLAAHPLLTEDTGTQGTGRYELELTHDLSHAKDADIETRAQAFNAVLSIGVAENVDVVVGVPYERLRERDGASRSGTHGFSDMEIAAKWRFHEAGALSFALRPGIGLPTGEEKNGLGAGHIVPNLFAVATYSSDPWAAHLHVGYTRNIHHRAEERRHLYHASVGVEYAFSEQVRLVADVSSDRHAERSGGAHERSAVLGWVYSATPSLDIDLGYRKGLTRSAPDHAWLTGLTARF